jgi:hypothetical protein
LQDIKRQIETALKKQMEADGGGYFVYYNSSKYEASLSLEGNVVTLIFSAPEA